MTSHLRSRIAVALVAIGLAPALATAQQAPDLAAFDRYVAQAARDWHVPGLAIAVVRNDSLIFAKGYGVLELGKPAPATEHTRFAIGSTTKAMTSAALAMLVDEGKLRWDEHVTDILPELQLSDPYVTRELTVRDLLTHRSGLPGTDIFWGQSENVLPVAEQIRRLRYVHPTASFRSTWQYHNVLYALGGAIIERTSGMPWEQFIRTRIFAPLGMTESIPLVSLIAGQPNVATPHAEVRDTVRVVPVRSTDGVASAGSVYSSVTDMSKWMRFMLDSGRVGEQRLITPANFRELIAPQIRAPMAEYPALELSQPHFFSYALGWFVQDYHGRTVWMHTGSIDGMCAIIGLLPEQRMGVYVLENLDHAELRHALMYKAFDAFGGVGGTRDWSADVRTLFASRGRGGRGATPQHVAGTHPTYALDKYVGTYVDSAYGTIDVTLANGTLNARWDKADVGPLEQWEYDVFRSRPKSPGGSATTLTFIPDGAGGISAVRAFGNSFIRSRGRTQGE